MNARPSADRCSPVGTDAKELHHLTETEDELCEVFIILSGKTRTLSGGFQHVSPNLKNCNAIFSNEHSVQVAIVQVSRRLAFNYASPQQGFLLRLLAQHEADDVAHMFEDIVTNLH